MPGPRSVDRLLALLNDAKAEWNSEVIGIVSDRFERRLVEETSKLRVELVQGLASLRQEIGSVRQDLGQEIAGVRQEMGALRQEMSENRFELLKWAFLFWVCQFFAVASVVAVLIRFLRPA